MPRSIHTPVLLEEVMRWLAPLAGQTIVDGTLGGGGHTRRLAEAVGREGRIIAFDRDPAALAAAEQNLKGLSVTLAEANFAELPEVLAQLDVPAVDGVLLDLGLSSDQLGDEARGFSFSSSGPLDLRFNPNEGAPAWRLLERLSAEALADLIYGYGEERFSRRIARAIVERRRDEPVRSAAQLAALVRGVVPRSRKSDIDPATRTFQALRIAVNEELKSLETALRVLPDCVRPEGRVAVISFHSLEDRLVKTAFRNDARYEPLTAKPIVASAEEVAANPRARSAKLRVARRRPG